MYIYIYIRNWILKKKLKGNIQRFQQLSFLQNYDPNYSMYCVIIQKYFPSLNFKFKKEKAKCIFNEIKHNSE